MTFALGAPHRGQTMPEVDRLAMKCSSLVCLDEAQEKKDARIAELADLSKSF